MPLPWIAFILLTFAYWNNVFSQGPLIYYETNFLEFSCPTEPNWLHAANHCYYIVQNTSLSWKDAGDYCTNLGGFLATVSDVRDTELISASVLNKTSNSSYWTGFQLSSPQELRGQKLDEYPVYSPLWAAGQPNYSAEASCVELNVNLQSSDYGWHTDLCQGQLPFLCEFVACFPGQFRCKDNRRCINHAWLCDGVEDCQDASDEANCNASCGGISEGGASEGVILSPGFSAGSYPNNAYCSWHIVVGASSRIRVTFVTFSTESDYDTLQIRDGPSYDSAKVLGTFSGAQLNLDKEIVSATNSLYFNFSSDATYTRRGFNLTWSEDSPTPDVHKCGTLLQAIPTVQTLTSFNYYRKGLMSDSVWECQWTIISVDQRAFVSVQFDDFSVWPGDRLELFDGNDTTAPLLGVIRNNSVAQVLLSTGSAVLIRFRSSPASTMKGFVAQYKSGCHDLRIRAPYGWIASPKSKLGRSCTWHISDPLNRPLTLLVDYVKLRNSDTLQIYKSLTVPVPEVTLNTSTQLAVSVRSDPSSTLVLDYKIVTITTESAFAATFSIDCPPLPQARYAVALTDVSSTHYGASVLYECQAGYIPAGDMVRKCQMNATWTGQAPLCLAVRCGPPPIVVKGYLTALSNTTLGSVATYSCYYGYRLMGGSQSTCTEFGNWSRPPVCEEISCSNRIPPTPPNAKNANLSTGSNYSARVYFTCNNDYNFVGVLDGGYLFDYCASDGTWHPSSPELSCQVKTCPALVYKYGSINGSIPVNTTIPVPCDSGFAASGQNITCQWNGSWSVVPTCQDIDECATPGRCKNMCRNLGGGYECYCPSGYHYDDTTGNCDDIDECTDMSNNCDSVSQCVNLPGSYECDCPIGYQLVTPSIQLSYDLGSWSNYRVNRSCVVTRCSPPSYLDHTVIVSSSSLYVRNSTLNLYCLEGYADRLSNRTRMNATCLVDGNWSEPLLKCEVRFCPPLNSPDHVLLTPAYGSDIIYTLPNGKLTNATFLPLGTLAKYSNCSSGTLLNGSTTRVCYDDGSGVLQWTGEDPTCDAITCMSISASLANGVVFSASDHGAAIMGDCRYFTCLPSHTLFGSPRICCQSTGEWSAPVPTCQPKTCKAPRLPPLVELATIKPTYRDYTVGEMLSVRCMLPGYSLEGLHTVQCTTPGPALPDPDSGGGPQPHFRFASVQKMVDELNQDDQFQQEMINARRARRPQQQVYCDGAKLESLMCGVASPQCHSSLPPCRFHCTSLVATCLEVLPDDSPLRIQLEHLDCQQFPIEDGCFQDETTINQYPVHSTPSPLAHVDFSSEVALNTRLIYAVSNATAEPHHETAQCELEYERRFQQRMRHLQGYLAQLSVCSASNGIWIARGTSDVTIFQGDMLSVNVSIPIITSGRGSPEQLHACLNYIVHARVLQEWPMMQLVSTNACGSLRLLDVDVFGGKNAARRKRADGSSTHEQPVSCSPPTVLNMTTDTYTTAGDTVELTCSVDAQCTGFVVTWSKAILSQDSSAGALASSTRLSAILFNASINTNTWRISPVEVADSGRYLCKVWNNGALVAQRGLFLTVEGSSTTPRRKPMPPTQMSAVKRNILHTSLPEGAAWVPYNLGSGKGWTLTDRLIRNASFAAFSQQQLPVFEVCDDYTANPQRFLAYRDQCDPVELRRLATTIYVRIRYTTKPCKSLLQPRDGCANAFNLLKMESVQDVGSNYPWNIRDFQLLHVLNASQQDALWSGSNATQETTVQFSLISLGFYLALQDAGACVSVQDVAIYFLACPEVRSGLTIFDETMAPRSQATPLAVHGRCVEGGRVVSPAPVLYCSHNGTWATDVAGTSCICDAGHMHVNNACVTKGPLCYACVNGSTPEECNSHLRTLEQCAPNEVCGTVVGFDALGRRVISKGCRLADECNAEATVNSISLCLEGTVACRLCCQTDYCNFVPVESANSQATWNTSLATCRDITPPQLHNCSTNVAIPLRFDGVPDVAEILLPTACDNSGLVHVTTEPPGLYATYRFRTRTRVNITATDINGLRSTCSFLVEPRDQTPPSLICPAEPVVRKFSSAEDRNVRIEYDADIVSYSDDVSEMVFSPPNGTLVPLLQTTVVTVTVRDSSGNSNSCRFRYVPKPSYCPLWPLESSAIDKTIPCIYTPPNGWQCPVYCARKLGLMPAKMTGSEVVCSAEGLWTLKGGGPLDVVPQCASMKPPALRIELHVAYLLRSWEPFCTAAIVNQTVERSKALLDYTNNRVLVTLPGSEVTYNVTSSAQRVDNQLNVTVTFVLDTNFSTEVATVNVLEYCFLEFQVLLGNTLPFSNLTVDGCLQAQASGYPHMSVSNFTFKCTPGSVQFAETNSSQGYACLRCVPGTFANADTQQCAPCPVGTYQDEPGRSSCQVCPNGTSTLLTQSHRRRDCIGICPAGHYSANGFEPCTACAVGTYQDQRQARGCVACARGTTTSQMAAILVANCRVPCPAGQYSSDGLQPCRMCPRDFYQPITQQKRCTPCPNGRVTLRTGATNASECFGYIPCLPGTCQNGATCIPRSTSGEQDGCLCPNGYRGADCSMKVSVCLEQTPCMNQATSLDIPGGQMQCLCPQGFYGDRCEHEVNPCETVQCKHGGHCIATTLGVGECQCPSGYSGPLCEEGTMICSAHDNASCGVGICVPQLNRRPDCNCNGTGRKGNRCQYPDNPCEYSPCANGTCYPNGPDTFYCSCNPGWTGQFCEVNQCLTAVCLNGATCVPGYTPHPNNYTCNCTWNYSGHHCEVQRPTNACASSPCSAMGTKQCVSHNDSFQCECEAAYFGERCDQLWNNCNSMPCMNGATCQSQPGSYNCSCPIGWTGVNCAQQYSACNSLPCGNGATCSDLLPANFTCLCPAGFTGTTCDTQLDACYNSPCYGNATCDRKNGSLAFTCQCPSGFTGSLCNTDINECTYPGICPRSDTLIGCSNFIGTYHCNCLPGYTGPNCTTVITNCFPDLCDNGGTCIPDVDGYRCACGPGYSGPHCEVIINPCLQSGACANGGTCIPPPTPPTSSYNYNYSCLCPPDFTGQRCETYIDDCASSPCQNDATCVDNIASFSCICQPSYTGPTCDKLRDANFNLYFLGTSNLSTPTGNESNIARSPEFDVPGAQMSFCFWVKFRSPEAPTDAESVFLTLEQISDVDGQNASPIVQFTSRAIYISQLAPSQPMKVIPLGINESLWHHVCFSWDGAVVKFALYVDGESQDNLPDAVAFDNLPHSLHLMLGAWPAGKLRPFAGELSAVSVLSTFLTLEDVRGMFNECSLWMQRSWDDPNILLHWVDFPPPQLGDTVVQVYPSICSLSQCVPGQANCAIDKFPPVFRVCPSDLTVVTQQRLAVVNWTDPEPTDNVDVVNLTQNYRSGQVFSWGEFQVMYVASDLASNTALCTFKVFVTPSNCTMPTTLPRSTIVVCHEFTAGVYCKVGCASSNYSFAMSVPPFYTCGLDGFWDSKDPDVPFQFPACSLRGDPSLDVDVDLQFGNLSCQDTTAVQQLKLDFEASINALNQKYRFCTDGSCDFSHIGVKCGTGRAKRQAPANQTSLSGDESVAFDLNLNLTNNTLVTLILNEIAQTKFSKTLVSRAASSALSCAVGSQLFNSECVLCAVGFFYNSSTKQCNLCPKNTYQSDEGQLSCIPCPIGRITSGVGAISLANCIKNCSFGYYYDSVTDNCTACPTGLYQPDQGSTFCLSCPPGMSTPYSAAQQISDCIFLCAQCGILECGPGHEMNVRGTCSMCPKGTYKSYLNESACMPCPYSSSTTDEGAVSVDNCTVRSCPKGKYLKANECWPCPRGQYQAETNQNFCNLCPKFHTTLYPGAMSVTDCKYGSIADYCTYWKPCNVNATCTNTNDQNNYRCTCKIGYTGDGYDNCTLICDSYCQNDGICTFSERDGATCKCPMNHPGLQCDAQSIDGSDERITSLIAGSAAGGLVFLILVLSLLIIFKVRFYRCLRCCKHPSLKDMASDQYYRNSSYTVTEVEGHGDVQTLATPRPVSPGMLSLDKLPYKEMSPNELYNEIYAGLQGLRADEADGGGSLSPDNLSNLSDTDLYTIGYENHGFERRVTYREHRRDESNVGNHHIAQQPTGYDDDDDIGADYFA